MTKKNMDILLGNILGKAAIHPPVSYTHLRAHET